MKRATQRLRTVINVLRYEDPHLDAGCLVTQIIYQLQHVGIAPEDLTVDVGLAVAKASPDYVHTVQEITAPWKPVAIQLYQHYGRSAPRMSYPGDPVFLSHGKWWFWDEVQVDEHGPYDTEEECDAALRDYGDFLTYGPPWVARR